MKHQNKTIKSRYLRSFICSTILITLLLGLSVSCKKTEMEEHQEPVGTPDIITLTEKSSELLTLKKEKVALRLIPIQFTASGRIGFNEKKLVHITSRVSGWVEKVYAFVGDKVRAGDTLVSIYSPEFLSAQGEFIQAEERLKSISQSDSVELHTATALYRSAKAKLLLLSVTEREAEELEDTHQPSSHLVIRSPLSGTVLESNVISGNVVQKGDNFFQLSDLSSLWITASVYEKDISLVRIGQRVTINTSAISGKDYQGSVEAISDVLDETTRTFKVRVLVDNKTGELKPEMFCEVIFESTLQNKLLAIPEIAVQSLGEEQVVFTPSGKNTFTKKSVKLGRHLGGFVEILGGLEPGEEIVTEGSYTLKSELMKGQMGEE
ncbi:MAG: hypothetical protein A2V86_04345 [Deltaproteobacteria bacterium RBG_16_49_23]|nr:MAG: hypothetical protein A2V86_04345 [Deltaproteobacteria bacterium RBG_16_49_23]